MTLIPGIKQISQVGNDMYYQGIVPVGIGTTNVDYLADPADTRLLAGRDPVLEEVSVGMSGVETEQKYTTGAQPLTVTDAMKGNLTYCEVQFSPKQDLHGYASPWPAGGGVNKLPPQNISGSMSDVVASTDGDVLTLNGTASAYGQALSDSTFTLPAGTYYLKEFVVSGTGAGVSPSYQLRSVDGLTIYANIYQANEFTLASDTEVKLRYVYQSGAVFTNYKIRAMLVVGSTAPTTYSPYSNICPIQGWTGAEVYIEPTYDPTATPKASVSFGDTYYGGTVDLTTGVLTATYASKDLGTLTWTASSTPHCFYANWFTNQYKMGNIVDALCSAYKYDGLASASPYFGVNGTFRLYKRGIPANPSEIYIHDDKYSDAAAFKTAMSGIQLVYELDTPAYYNFPGAHSITLEEGTNTIWTDTNGTDISVTYVTKK